MRFHSKSWGRPRSKKRAAPGSSKCSVLRCAAFQLCCPLRLFPTTAPSGPSAGLSMPGLGARHRREDRRPLPGWKIRSESVSSRATLVWAAQANAVGNPNQGRRSPLGHTCTSAAPSSLLPPLCRASVQRAPNPLQHPNPPGAPESIP